MKKLLNTRGKLSTSATRLILALFAIITGLLISVPGVVNASEVSTPAEGVEKVNVTVNNVADVVAPVVTNEDIEGKVERGGSAIYGIIQTVVIYASYIGFAIGILWIIIGFGRNGRMGGVTLMFFSSLAYFFIGYGPEIVAWLGQWFTSL